jgi:hypothetical protein
MRETPGVARMRHRLVLIPNCTGRNTGHICSGKHQGQHAHPPHQKARVRQTATSRPPAGHEPATTPRRYSTCRASSAVSNPTTDAANVSQAVAAASRAPSGARLARLPGTREPFPPIEPSPPSHRMPCRHPKGTKARPGRNPGPAQLTLSETPPPPRARRSAANVAPTTRSNRPRRSHTRRQRQRQDNGGQRGEASDAV